MNYPNLPKEQIFYVDQNYRKLILYVTYQILEKHPGIPLEPEDIYYQFLYTVPAIFKKYEPEKGSFKTFLLLCARGFVKNICRYWSKKGHRIMNLVTPMDLEVADQKAAIIINDQNLNSLITNFSLEEKKIYHYYFVENFTCNQIAKKMKQSHHTIAKKIKIIQSKIKRFFDS